MNIVYCALFAKTCGTNLRAVSVKFSCSFVSKMSSQNIFNDDDFSSDDVMLDPDFTIGERRKRPLDLSDNSLADGQTPDKRKKHNLSLIETNNSMSSETTTSAITPEVELESSKATSSQTTVEELPLLFRKFFSIVEKVSGQKAIPSILQNIGPGFCFKY